MKSEIQHISKDEQYQQLLQHVIERAKIVQYRTSVGMNQEQIRFYWFIGEDIVRLQTSARYGDSFLYQLSDDLQHLFPDHKGFSYRNLQYMKKMYLTFAAQGTNLPQLVAKSSPDTVLANLPQPVADFEIAPQLVAQKQGNQK